MLDPDANLEPTLLAGGGSDGLAVLGGGPIELLLPGPVRPAFGFAARDGVVVRDMPLAELAFQPAPSCFVGDTDLVGGYTALLASYIHFSIDERRRRALMERTVTYSRNAAQIGRASCRERVF